MARADLYKIAKYAIKLHDMLKNVSEERGLEGWQQAKITKASDYISSVYHNLDYDMKFGDQSDEIGPDIEMQMGESTDKYKTTLSSKLEEKITAKTKMGDVIKDFQKSDAPQFKGKSDEKKRQMAIAAKLNAERKSND